MKKNFQRLTDFLDGFLKNGLPWYDCVVYQNGREVYRRWNGFLDRKKIIPANGKERYNIYSCSKTITCVAALQLCEKGLYVLEDKISDYIPEFKETWVSTEDGVKRARKPITIKDLFCMRSGIINWTDSPQFKTFKEETGGKVPTLDFIKWTAKQPFLFEAGERWHYGLSHDVLAALIEVLTGMRFGEYVKRNIFDPLGMKNSTFLLPDNEMDTLCPQYRYDNQSGALQTISKRIQGFKFGAAYESGSAGCISTVDDYITFLEAIRTGELLKEQTVDLMATNHLTDAQLKNGWFGEYGYGLGVRCSRGNDGITDFGWGGMAGHYAIIDKTKNLTAFYAQHVINSERLVGYAEVLQYIYDALA